MNTRDRITFYCYPFGRPFDGRYITSHSVKTARDLAAFHFRVPRHLVTVKLADLPTLYPKVSF